MALIALVAVLVVSNIAFAVLYMTRDVNITAGVESAQGSIEVYQGDGVTVLTSFDYPNFTAGVYNEWTQDFFINNTGNTPVYVYWNMSTSSIPWYEVAGSYYHDEAATTKYSFYITNTSVQWVPNVGGWEILVDQAFYGEMNLIYWGTPKTTETFSFTVTFYARDA